MKDVQLSHFEIESTNNVVLKIHTTLTQQKLGGKGNHLRTRFVYFPCFYLWYNNKLCINSKGTYLRLNYCYLNIFSLFSTYHES